MRKREMKSTKAVGVKSLATTLSLMIFILLAVTALFLGGFGVYFLNQSMKESMEKYEQARNEGYNTEIKSEVESAIAVIQGYYQQYEDGKMSLEKAQETAMETIRSMRYREDGSGYMWIDATDYTLLMHPILPNRKERTAMI